MEFENLEIIHGLKFGTVLPLISLEDMKEKGIEFGDSLNIYLDNGDEILDVPYYNGFYVRSSGILVCGYPGYEHPAIGRNNGGDIWVEHNLSETNHVSIELNEKAKYLKIQNALDTVYTNKREDYATDDIFANYRYMTGGKIKEGIFYRSATPCDNTYNRAKYTNICMERDRINFILNISDNMDEIIAYRKLDTYDYPYFDKLMSEDKVALLDLSADYAADGYRNVLTKGLIKMIQYEGPYLTHCTEGKDRTGFVSLLIESLMGASYEELRDDYMVTYDNYYGINSKTNPEKYQAIEEMKFMDMALYLAGVEDKKDIKTPMLEKGAREYLFKGGMSEEQIDLLIRRLAK